MPYVTGVERIGIRKGDEFGLKKGSPQGEALILRRLSNRRFGPMPAWAEAKLNQASTDNLELWADRVLTADNLDAVFRDRD